MPSCDASNVISRLSDPDIGFDVLVPVDFVLARCRLSAFQFKHEWRVTLERVGFSFPHGGVIYELIGVGPRRDQSYHTILPDWLLPVGQNGRPHGFEENDSGIIEIEPFRLHLRIGGNTVTRHLTEESYAREGISLTEEEPGGTGKVMAIARFLCNTNPSVMFLSNEEVLGRVQSPSLKRLVQVFDWWHPDVRKHEAVRDSGCLVSLANAIAQHDAAVYVCMKEHWNTGWNHWKAPAR